MLQRGTAVQAHRQQWLVSWLLWGLPQHNSSGSVKAPGADGQASAKVTAYRASAVAPACLPVLCCKESQALQSSSCCMHTNTHILAGCRVSCNRYFHNARLQRLVPSLTPPQASSRDSTGAVQQVHTLTHMSIQWVVTLQLGCTSLKLASAAVSAVSASRGRLAGHTANTLGQRRGGLVLSAVNTLPPRRLGQQQQHAIGPERMPAAVACEVAMPSVHSIS